MSPRQSREQPLNCQNLERKIGPACLALSLVVRFLLVARRVNVGPFRLLGLCRFVCPHQAVLGPGRRRIAHAVALRAELLIQLRDDLEEGIVLF